MNIIYFSDAVGLNIPDIAAEQVYFYKTMASFLEHQGEHQHAVDCFVIGKFQDPNIATQLLSTLVQDLVYGLKPIYALESLGEYYDALIDGILPPLEEMKSMSLDMAEYAKILPEAPVAADKDTVLLRFLYVRPSRGLIPICTWLEKEIYQHPLLHLFCEKEILVSQWYDSLSSRKLIEAKSLVDRIRNCPVCSLSHLNYIDACFNCHSLDIEETAFLHCFTCGYIGNQQEFLQQEKMICPKCHARLRHIGTDYDRPLENFHCKSCQENFIEPTILARCFNCKTINETDNLITQNIYEYILTDLAKLNVRNNSISDIYAVLDDINYTTPKYFEYQLNWSIKISRRYSEVYFSLITIDIQGVTEIAATLGRSKTHLLLQECAERIRSAIRDTDITTRTRENRLWILTPQTKPEGCQIIINRLNQISKDTEQQDKKKLTFKIVYISSGDFDASIESAESIMAKLSMELE